MIDGFVWRIRGDFSNDLLKEYIVVRLLIDVIDERLFPQKDVPRLIQNFERIKSGDGSWMPAIKFSKRNNEIDYKYAQGSHTAYSAALFADGETKMCIMIRRNDLEIFREFMGKEPFEVFSFEQYQNELPPHERKDYSHIVDL